MTEEQAAEIITLISLMVATLDRIAVSLDALVTSGTEVPLFPQAKEVTETKVVGPQAYVELPLTKKTGPAHGGL